MTRAHLRRVLPIATAVGLLAAAFAPAAAHADRYYHADKRGDVRVVTVEPPGNPVPRDVRTDIASVGVDYGPSRLRITLTGVDITTHTGGAFVIVDTPKRLAYTWQPIAYDDFPFYFINLPKDARRMACPGLVHRVDRAHDVVLFSIPNRCVGNATKVRVGAQLYSGSLRSDRTYIDDALSPTLPDYDETGPVSPWIARG